jgi:hypothetical protein
VRGPGVGLGSDRLGWPGRTSTPTSESDHRRGKFDLRKGRIRAASLLGGGTPERRPCETNDVTRAEFRRLGGPAGQGGRAERVECSEGRGRGGKGTFIVASGAMPDQVG